MSHFNIPIGHGGPLIDAFITVSAARQSALEAASRSIPDPQKIRALLDTGASHSCLDPVVVTALGIPVTGNCQINTPSSGAAPHTVDLYDVGIYIPATNPPPLVFPTVAVAGCQLFQAQGFHALIGRDILDLCMLFYNGPLKVLTLSF